MKAEIILKVLSNVFNISMVLMLHDMSGTNTNEIIENAVDSAINDNPNVNDSGILALYATNNLRNQLGLSPE